MNDTTEVPGKVPYLNKDAIVSISIGTNSISHIQLALSLLTKDRNMDGIGDRITSGTVTEPAEIAIVGLSAILAEIYKVGQSTGQISYREFSVNDLQ